MHAQGPPLDSIVCVLIHKKQYVQHTIVCVLMHKKKQMQHTIVCVLMHKKTHMQHTTVCVLMHKKKHMQHEFMCCGKHRIRRIYVLLQAQAPSVHGSGPFGALGCKLGGMSIIFYMSLQV